MDICRGGTSSSFFGFRNQFGSGLIDDGRQDPKSHAITDFFSFYNLPSSVIGNTKHAVVDAVYLFYYATDAAFSPPNSSQTQTKEEVDAKVDERLRELISDALIIADQVRVYRGSPLTGKRDKN